MRRTPSTIAPPMSLLTLAQMFQPGQMKKIAAIPLALLGWPVSSGYTLRTLFWLTGLLAFFISPVADNLTTALIMAAVALAVGAGNPTFIAVSCINIVVAANAGGAFSPFGDITTLMVWQSGQVHFWDFFHLFI